MSDYTIGIVVEGPTDRIVIKAALQHILAEKTFTITQLQPELSDGFGGGGFGATASGWGGVYQWCRQIVRMGADLTNHPALQKFDFLIIHLDADVAEKNYTDANIINPVNDDLPCAKPCPPAADSIQALKRVIWGWFETEQFPRSFILCIPSKCIEAWVGVALYGQNDSDILADIEYRLDIENYLAQKPARERLIRNRNGNMKKITDKYREKSDEITSRWGYITDNCHQASVFTEHIIALI